MTTRAFERCLPPLRFVSRRPAKGLIATISTALVLLGGTRAAVSAVATANATLNASIPASCNISPVTAPTIAYDPVVTNAVAPAAAQFNISYTCTVGSAPVITLDEGSNKATASTPAAPARRLANGTVLMTYNIFSSTATRTTGTPAVAWGTANAPALSSPTGVTQTVTAFIAIAAAQSALTTGAYTDRVGMIITF